MLQINKWNYKNHECFIHEDMEEDCIKYYGSVTNLETGWRYYPDILPYVVDKESIELWIDAGYPERLKGKNTSPLTKDYLRTLAERSKELKNNG